MKVCCVFSLESPHRGDSNENTQYTIFIIKKKVTLNYLRSAAMGFFFHGTQEPVRNSRGKRAISVRAIEGLLYFYQLPNVLKGVNPVSHYLRVYSQDVASVSFLIQGKILNIGTPKIITIIVLKNGRLKF